MAIKIILTAKSMGKQQIQKLIISDGICLTSFSDGSVKRVYEAMFRDRKNVSLKDNLLIERFIDKGFRIGKPKEEIAKLKIEEIEKLKGSIGNTMEISYTKEII